jgi:RimJ/RimL family protein N-acetyltransferase
MAWVEARGCTSIYAVIHSRNAASAGVARRLGLREADEEIDGDRIWRKPRA